MSATVSCVDVGQGDCTLAVDAESGAGILIDCRESEHHTAVAELARLQCRSLRAAIVTHTHMDHFGGVLDVLEALGDRFDGIFFFNHDSFMAVPVVGQARTERGQKLRALLFRAAEFGDDRVKRAERDGSTWWAGVLQWRILAPTYGDVRAAIVGGDTNVASGIVELSVGDQVVLVGGDAPLAAWEKLTDVLPKRAVLRWPHHGGSLSKTEKDAEAKLFALIEPLTVIVSVGNGNIHEHPTKAFFDARAIAGTPLLCTQATSRCVAGGGNGGVCAGTIRITLGGREGLTVTPDASDHGAVVAGYGNGQCLRTSEPVPTEESQPIFVEFIPNADRPRR